MVLILTDDQGFGDHGSVNELVSTPHLDALRSSSMWTSRFYVTPVCSTTRASIMTGKYHPAVGAFVNGDPLPTGQVTLAEVLAAAGYATGIFGKWHLGTHYPHRPQDQGFEETLVFRGGILRELEPEPVDVRYTDPMLLHNGELERASGFATDVFFAAALEWIARMREQERPFFAYIPTAAPHQPLTDPPLPEFDAYRSGGLEAELAATYALVSRIDANVGMLLESLDTLGIAEHTLVLFTSDNGAANQRFSAGLRGGKAEVLEGGIRQPLLLRWQGRLAPGEVEDLTAAHVDLLPTLMSACSIDSSRAGLDGIDLWPYLSGDVPEPPAPRSLFFHCRRDADFDRNWAVLSGEWKLVRADGIAGDSPAPARLFRIHEDPGEEHDLAASHPEVVAKLGEEYGHWVERVRGQEERQADTPIVGVPEEDPLLLTFHSEDPDANRWRIEVARAGTYRAICRFRPVERPGVVILDVHKNKKPGGQELERFAAGAGSCTFESLQLEEGPCVIRTRLRVGKELTGGDGVWQIELSRLE